MLSITDISIRIAGRLLIDEQLRSRSCRARASASSAATASANRRCFHAIRGDLPTESGSITIPPRWRIGSLAQEAPDGPESLVTVSC